MKQRRINATLAIAALALTTFLILTVLPRAGTAAPTVASLSTNPKRINESAAAHSFIRSPFVDSTPGATTRISAAPRLERQPLESLTRLNSTEATERGAPSVASVVQPPGTTTRISAAPRLEQQPLESQTTALDWAPQLSSIDCPPLSYSCRQSSPITVPDGFQVVQVTSGLGGIGYPGGLQDLEPGRGAFGSYLYFIDSGTIYRVDPSGGTPMSFTSVPNALVMRFGFGGDLFVSTTSGSVVRVRPDGTTSVFAEVSSSIEGMAFDTSTAYGNRLFVSEWGYYVPGTLSAIDADGVISAFVPEGNIGIEPTGLEFCSPSSSPNETLYVIDQPGTVFQVTPNGTVSLLGGHDLSSAILYGETLACSQSQTPFGNYLYIAEQRSQPPGRLLRVSFDGVIEVFATGFAGFDLLGVTGLKFSADGLTLYVTDDVGRAIYAIRAKQPTPFLDLPFDYGGSVSAFLQALKNWSVKGRVNSWFDHKYPDYTSGYGIWRYEGKPHTKNEKWMSGVLCYENYCYDGHNGIDFARPKEDEPWPVLAAASGIVTYTNPIDAGDLGKYVVLYHDVDQGNAYYTRYAHLHGISVTVGITVTSHHTLGMAGNSGKGKGHHLHFEVHRDDGDQVWEPSQDKVVDPFGWERETVTDPWVEMDGFPSYRLWLHDPAQKKSFAGDQGTVITDTAGNIQATIPPGAFSGQVTLELSPGPVAGTSAQLRTSGHSFWLRVLEWLPGEGSLESAMALSSSDLFTTTQPITLTVAYTDTDLLHLDESQLTLHCWDEDQETWHPLTTTVDTVQNVVMASTQDLGGFDLQASLLCTTDDLEPDDGYQAARRVWPNDWPLARGLDIPQDSDWVSLEAVQGVTYTISTQNLAGGADTVLNLYDVDAVTLLASNDDAGGEPASELVWTAPYTGTFFIETVNAPGGTTGCSATYELTIATIPGDVIADCQVNIADIMEVAIRWHLNAANPDPDNDPTTPNYEPRFDLYQDGIITVVDIMLVAVHWGETCG